jgi:DNA-binding ferritin-like protein
MSENPTCCEPMFAHAVCFPEIQIEIFHNIPYANHEVAGEHEDVTTASLLENFIDEAEKRCWFLFEAGRGNDRTGH